MLKDVYNEWVNCAKVSPEDKLVLRAMNDEAINEAFGSKLRFGTAGIRELMGPGTGRMNEFTYTQITCAYSVYLRAAYPDVKNLAVAIAHDNRRHGVRFAKICAEVFSSYGIAVHLFPNDEPTATPILSYAIPRLNCQGGLIVTASHNPKDYNGYKAYKHTGAQLMDDQTAIIMANMEMFADVLNIAYTPQPDLISVLPPAVIDDYLAAVAKIQVHPGLDHAKTKVVYTAQHGCGSKTMPRLLRQLGYEVVGVAEQLVFDPEFSATASSNPEDPVSFELAIGYAEKTGAELILAADPDADRLGIAIKRQGQWKFMTGNEMGIIYTHYLSEQNALGVRPYIVSSWVSTNLIDRIAAPHGIEIFRVGTGFKWMGNKVDEVHAGRHLVVAFEEAIGALNSDLNREKDSFQAGVMAAEIWTYYQQKGMDFVDVLENEVYPRYGHWLGGTVAFTFIEHNWRELGKARMDALKGYPRKKILDRTVASVGFDAISQAVEWLLEGDSFIKFRLSGTEPKFKIYFNLYGADTAALLEERAALTKEIASLIGIKQ